ncbi:recombinase family protein [Leptolyngbya sp. NIES-2104]|nr:recombinase family protein [Leptolyngbya sp. NIES-2104]GAQ00136.1 DNA-invertase [Leptolyngbya sp. NIES-2104]
MLVGYARISTPDQALDLQLDALKQVGCERWFTDIASGAKSDRPGLSDAMNFVRKDDVLVVWKLDRLGRSLSHLIETITLLNEQGVGFKSLSESLDTTTSGGRLIFNIFGAIAEFERGLIQERTHAGLKAARARGRKGGRRHALTAQKIAMGKQLAADPNHSITEICKLLGCSQATYYRFIHSSTLLAVPQEATASISETSPDGSTESSLLQSRVIAEGTA